MSRWQSGDARAHWFNGRAYVGGAAQHFSATRQRASDTFHEKNSDFRENARKRWKKTF